MGGNGRIALDQGPMKYEEQILWNIYKGKDRSDHEDMTMRYFFEDELNHITNLNPDILRSRFQAGKLASIFKPKAKTYSSFPRRDVEDPWHMIDFSKFIKYASSRPNPKKPYILDKAGFLLLCHQLQ